MKLELATIVIGSIASLASLLATAFALTKGRDYLSFQIYGEERERTVSIPVRLIKGLFGHNARVESGLAKLPESIFNVIWRTHGKANSYTDERSAQEALAKIEKILAKYRAEGYAVRIAQDEQQNPLIVILKPVEMEVLGDAVLGKSQIKVERNMESD